jgi:hypothetical protein
MCKHNPHSYEVRLLKKHELTPFYGVFLKKTWEALFIVYIFNVIIFLQMNWISTKFIK